MLELEGPLRRRSVTPSGRVVLQQLLTSGVKSVAIVVAG